MIADVTTAFDPHAPPAMPPAVTTPLPDDMRVLLVDDDDICAMSLARALAKIGVDRPVHRARDGEQALAILRAAAQSGSDPVRYLVLLDLNMPGMGGIEFLESVSRTPPLQMHPIFVLTTSDVPRAVTAALTDQITAYVFKDRPLPSLRAALDQLALTRRA